MEGIQQQKHHNEEKQSEKFCLNWKTVLEPFMELLSVRGQVGGFHRVQPDSDPKQAPRKDQENTADIQQ